MSDRKTSGGAAARRRTSSPPRQESFLSPYRKAVTAAVFGGVAALGAAMLDGNLTGPEAIVAAGMALTAGAATWRIPND